MRFSVEVLGCKVNQYEAEQIKELLAGAGEEALECGDADLVVIHSCAVTAEAVRKVRQTIRRCADAAPGARIFVTGCAARAGLVDSELPDFTYIEPGAGWLARFALLLPEAGSQHFDQCELGDDMLPLRRFSGHHRAFLKIQDGCDIGCSYCIVPSLRGASRDKPLADIVSEARGLVAAGHREIVVTGVSVGLYGKGGGHSLAAVIDNLLRIDGLDRLRLSSLHPSELNEELLDVWSRSRKMMPHIHLPLQSGSDSVLGRMRRGYGRDEFLAAVDRAKSCLDTPAISTDVIVGFPGETDSDFADTEAVAREAGFSRMHIFPFSTRPGTEAAGLGDPVARATVRARVQRLRELAIDLQSGFYSRLIGLRTSALAESFDCRRRLCHGYTERYVPVEFAGEPGNVGRIMQLRLESPTRSGMRASAAI